MAAHAGTGVSDRSLDGETLRLGDRQARRGPGGADSRRLWLHGRISGLALLPQRQGSRDRRGHERGPAHLDRQGPVRLHRTSWRRWIPGGRPTMSNVYRVGLLLGAMGALAIFALGRMAALTAA